MWSMEEIVYLGSLPLVLGGLAGRGPRALLARGRRGRVVEDVLRLGGRGGVGELHLCRFVEDVLLFDPGKKKTKRVSVRACVREPVPLPKCGSHLTLARRPAGYTSAVCKHCENGNERGTSRHPLHTHTHTTYTHHVLLAVCPADAEEVEENSFSINTHTHTNTAFHLNTYSHTHPLSLSLALEMIPKTY